jgi:hypothetical protein
MSEAITPINGSIGFAVNTRLYINPGLAATFPWLSEQAKRWQQYRFNKLIFRYITRTSTSTIGSVILSPDYNAIETVPLSDSEASNTQDAVENSPWTEISCRLDPKAMFPFGPRKNIRNSLVTGDLSNYDAGRMFICTSGMANVNQVGRLYVEYDVELFVPQSTVLSLSGPTTITQVTRGTPAQTLTSSVATNVGFNIYRYNPLGITPTASPNPLNAFQCPIGVYHIWGYVTVQSSIAADIIADCFILKNNAPLPGEVIGSVQRSISSSVSPVIQLYFDNIVIIDSINDYVAVNVNIVSVGTITLEGTSNVINFQVC